MNYFGRLSRTINKWVEYSLFGLGFTMTLIVAVQVFCRYALNHSLFWAEELSRYLLVWLTFLGASVAYRRKVHPGIDVIYHRLPVIIQKIFSNTVHFISIAFFGVMIFYGVKFSYFVRLQISPALYIPKWVIFCIIPFSGLILLIHSLTFLVNEVKGTDRDS